MGGKTHRSTILNIKNTIKHHKIDNQEKGYQVVTSEIILSLMAISTPYIKHKTLK